VEIPPDAVNPNTFFWPPCVNVSRCGGCCVHDALTCTPVTRRLDDFTVAKMIFDSTGTVVWSGEVLIQLEAHTACDCSCRVLAADCNNRTQRYDADSCSCRCINESLSGSCQAPKHWSQQLCACVCPNMLNCLDDEYFNYATCTCQRLKPAAAVSAPPATPGPHLRDEAVDEAELDEFQYKLID
jgi:hypothetical protein